MTIYKQPSDIGFDIYFDPNLSFENQARFYHTLTFLGKSPLELDHSNQYNSTLDFDPSYFLAKDEDDVKWIQVSGTIHSSLKIQKTINHTFYLFNSHIIDKSQLNTAQEWASVQNFDGRWMPAAQNIYMQCLLYEYMWSSAYETSELTSRAEISRDIPFKMHQTTAEFIPDPDVLANPKEYEKAYTFVPSPYLMEKMNLSLGKELGHSYKKDGTIASITAPHSKLHNYGLVFNKEIFDKFLLENDKVLFMDILGHAQTIDGDLLRISGYYFYEPNTGFTGQVQILPKAEPE